MGKVPDVRRCVTMDLKESGNSLVLIGTTKSELGGSHYHLVSGQTGGQIPMVDFAAAPTVFAKVHEAITKGLVRSCHDLSEGGLAVAVAEMAFAGNIGTDITGLTGNNLPDAAALFGETPTRFVVEVAPGEFQAFADLFAGVPFAKLGQTCLEPRLRIAGSSGEWLIWAPLEQLKKAWQQPLQW